MVSVQQILGFQYGIFTIDFGHDHWACAREVRQQLARRDEKNGLTLYIIEVFVVSDDEDGLGVGVHIFDSIGNFSEEHKLMTVFFVFFLFLAEEDLVFQEAFLSVATNSIIIFAFVSVFIQLWSIKFFSERLV